MLRTRAAALAVLGILGFGSAGAQAPPDSPPLLGDEEQEAFAEVRWEADAEFPGNGGFPPDAGFSLDGDGATATATVPEPGTLVLLGTGLAALALRRRRSGPR
jgi:hypothetical protein